MDKEPPVIENFPQRQETGNAFSPQRIVSEIGKQAGEFNHSFNKYGAASGVSL